MNKRRASGSGLQGAELLRAINTLEELERLSRKEELEDAQLREGAEAYLVPAAKPVSESRKITDLVAALRAKAEGPLAFAFSSINNDILGEHLNISSRGMLSRHGNHADRVAESIAQGDGRYMTSEGMYRHLNMLENLIPQTNEASARLWIDAIFFRVSAMLSLSSDSKRMVLNVEQHIPSVGISVPGRTRSLNIYGTINYAALMTEPRKHEFLMQSPQFYHVRQEKPNGLFVTRAKQEGTIFLADHVPQAVGGLYAAAKHLKKKIIRGALTNGHAWIFLILYLNANGIGGTYARSPAVKILVGDTYPYSVLSPGPDIVAGILAYWMEHSFDDLDENDWFSSPL